MNLPTTNRCPVCGALTTAGQTVCTRCFEPLVASPQLAAPQAATGDTCTIYRAHNGTALLVLSPSLLEYDSSESAFSTNWSNAAALTCVSGEYFLQLHQTPTMLCMPLGNGRAWLSAQTRRVPLNQFGYPTNRPLISDLLRFAPHLRGATR